MRERRSEIKAQIQSLREELVQLDVAESALANKASAGDQKSKNLPTIKEMALEVLGKYRRGARANEILSAIEASYGVKIPRESLSPQLTRLQQNDHKVILIGRKWCLAQEINPPSDD